MKHLSIILITLFYFINPPVSMAQYYWQTLANVPEKLTFPVVVALNGKIHVMGGGGASGATNVHYAYDPGTNKWETMAPVPYSAQQPAGAVIAGRIHYFGGGFPNSGKPLTSHYSYDPVKNTWKKETDLTVARAIHYGVGLNDTLYSMAGQGMKNLFQAYDTTSKKWSSATDLPDDNFWYGAHIVTKGKIYRFGGGGFNGAVSTASVYDPKTKVWSSLPDLEMGIHAMHGSAIGDSIYIGGGNAGIVQLDKVWIYDIKKNTYEAGPTMWKGRTYHRMVTIDKCIYSVGGNSDNDENMPLSLIRHCPGVTQDIKNVLFEPENIIVKTGPGSLEINISPSVNLNGLSVDLTDLTGRIVYSKTFGGNDSHQIVIPTESFSASMYIVNVKQFDMKYSKRVVVRH